MRTILPILLLVISGLHPAQADEQRTFFGNTVEGWLQVLRDKTSTEGDRQRAINALGYFGPEAKAAVPDLIEEVRQGPLKRQATGALVSIGAGTEVTIPYLIDRFIKKGCFHFVGTGTILYDDGERIQLAQIGGPAVPALLEVLKGPNTSMRVCAAEALGRIGPAAREAVPLLIRAIEHPENNPHAEILSHYAVKALGLIGPEAKAAVPILNHLDDTEAVIALSKIGVPPVRSLLDDLLREGDWPGTFLLVWLGPKAREATPALRAALTDKRAQVRINAAVALAHIAPSAPETVPVLIEALNHQGDEELDASEVTGALAHLGPQAKAALPALIGFVKEGSANEDIVKALVQIDPEGKECVPSLIAALKHDDSEVVFVAANCLSLLGPRAGEAAPSLVAAVTRKFDGYSNNNPQVSAAHALKRIGPRAKSAIPALIDALHYRHIVRPQPDEFEVVRKERERDCLGVALAAQVLGSFGADAKAAVPALIEAIQTREKDDANWEVRKAAILALGQIGPDAKDAIPVLRNMMKEHGRDSQYQPELVVAIYQLTPDGKALAEEWLTKSMSPKLSPEFGLELRSQIVVIGALGRTSFEADLLTRSYLGHLETNLGYDDPREDPTDYLEEWFELLGRLGVGGRLAIPRLNELRKHPNPWVRMWATEALERIMPLTPR